MVYEIINEKSISDIGDQIGSYITVFYHHCLKWVIQPTHQGTSWVRSIITSSENASKILYKSGTNVRNYVSENLNKSYKEAITETIEVLSKYEKQILQNTYVFSSFDSIDKITDEQYVRAWLIRNAYNDEAVEAVNNKK